jgi:hypothetical protein
MLIITVAYASLTNLVEAAGTTAATSHQQGQYIVGEDNGGTTRFPNLRGRFPLFRMKLRRPGSAGGHPGVIVDVADSEEPPTPEIVCPESPPFGSGQCAIQDYANLSCGYDYVWVGCEEPMSCQSITDCSCEDDNGTGQGTWLCKQMGVEGCLAGAPELSGAPCVPTSD